MTITIFHTESNSSEEWLLVNDDRTLTHHTENSGWAVGRTGVLPRDKIISAEAAKARWPPYADKIEEALVQVAAKEQ